mmetsp:Transcript_25827/g.48852  ORF Transcript_25827/g.48852 Transcript_25827/m.48852 type:complete len:209 (-) Transcript_25827:1458-2084(-)
MQHPTVRQQQDWPPRTHGRKVPRLSVFRWTCNLSRMRRLFPGCRKPSQARATRRWPLRSPSRRRKAFAWGLLIASGEARPRFVRRWARVVLSVGDARSVCLANKATAAPSTPSASACGGPSRRRRALWSLPGPCRVKPQLHLETCVGTRHCLPEDVPYVLCKRRETAARTRPSPSACGGRRREPEQPCRQRRSCPHPVWKRLCLVWRR